MLQGYLFMSVLYLGFSCVQPAGSTEFAKESKPTTQGELSQDAGKKEPAQAGIVQAAVPPRAFCPKDSLECFSEKDMTFRFLIRREDQTNLVKGTFKHIQGHVKTGPDGKGLQGAFDFDTRTVDTSENLRDERLRNHFFISDQFPNIRFSFGSLAEAVLPGQSMPMDMNGRIDIWQEQVPLNFRVQVTRTDNWLTIAPIDEIVIDFQKLSIFDGITYLEDFCVPSAAIREFRLKILDDDSCHRTCRQEALWEKRIRLGHLRA